MHTHCHSVHGPIRTALPWIVGGLLVLAATSRISARPNIREAFFQIYPNAVGTPLDTVYSNPVHCGLCHYNFNGGGLRNLYGIRLGQVIGNFPNSDLGRQQAILSIQTEDSDNDTFSTLTEMTDMVMYGNTPTFPGLTPSHVGLVQSVDVAEIVDFLVPQLAPDTTPPDVQLISPNGGEIVVGNSGVVVQWSASDDSGIGWVALYFSIDDGATYRPIAEFLENDGTHTWYVANRPAMTARIRVVATDNAYNVAADASDSAFTIMAPPGGLVPSTLRDFDMGGTQPFEAASISEPMLCGGCHGGYDPAVEPYFTWQGNMMAHASRDPLFEASMAIANQDAPDSGDLCLRCHIPSAWARGRSIPTDGSQALESDKHGVACDLCHRMVDPVYDAQANPVEDAPILAALSMPPMTLGNGQLVIDPEGRRRGPFADATMGHEILVSPFHREAAFCGACHDVSNPVFERDGLGHFVPNAYDAPAANLSVQNLMPLERTYSEWLASAYNTPEGIFAPQFGGNRQYVSSCQHCHLRAVTGQGCIESGVPIRPDLPLHDMTGGSTWMTGLMATLYPNDVDPAAIQAGVLRARYMLQNAATLNVQQAAGQLKVTVFNETGHKLPTGYSEGRRIVGSSRVDLQACKLEYSIVSPK